MRILPIVVLLTGSAGSADLPAVEPFPSARADTVSPDRPRPPTRLYAGMWSVHLRDLAPTLTANHLLALSHDGYFVGTFVNSFNERGMAAGLTRDLVRWGADRAALSVGWRGGLVTGYDERLLDGLGDRWPVIPFLQVLGNVDWRRVGVEFSWSGIVVSAATSIRLGG
jgi:hypothetical protein